MTPNRKDVAEFLRLGLRYQVISVEAVVAWADGVIAEDDEPPAWAIEPAFAKTADAANDQLKLCAGVPQGDLPVRIALGLVSLRWAEQQLNVEDMRKIGWDLYSTFLYRPCFDFIYEVSDEVLLWGCELEYHCNLFDTIHGGNWRTSHNTRQLIDKSLEPYAAYESLLPPVIRDDQRAPED